MQESTSNSGEVHLVDDERSERINLLWTETAKGM